MKPHNLDIKSLQIFQMLVEQENMTHAARHLKMTQPTVSYALQKLEQQLETQLFDRQMRPTAAGTLLYQHAQKLEANDQRFRVNPARGHRFSLSTTRLPETGDYFLR